MSKPIDTYWTLRLAELKQTLEKNNFDVFMADSLKDAKRVFEHEILPSLEGVKTVGSGGSVTLADAGILDFVREHDGLEFFDPYNPALSNEDKYELRRQSLLTDLFLTGTNAVTECGKLVNLDMIGNRVAALNFGPKHVVLFISRNKLVETVDDAMFRIKDYVAPVNTMRLDMKTPCKKTGHCMDCSSPQRICNIWTITEKSFPAKRIKIVLINEDAGY
ncbi:lactate utilization protein [Halodesulfovibrio spirochaetisodalis]|uniref:Lactate utilization protein B/C n=1 Tax=Halodesulfovibrio spirochaetisodalis TaxID=1560234 RepID=A0A1B7X9Z3_9BACT|nr:lactate utilization protein [Halodesulfovibrio spirochaetisodalis]OBQ46191.1 lactate utilization protein B/C [Halodesulfovibrio spirochaetisodalis]